MASGWDSDGGYGYKFTTVETTNVCLCEICHLPSRNPYMTQCCGHIFCKFCLDSAKKVNTNCPVCRSAECASVPDKHIDRVVRSLHVYCTNKEKGCKWQGEVNYIGDHLGRSDGCDFEDVQCSNKCGEIVQRQYLDSHLETKCPCRIVNCQYCQLTGEHQFIEGQHKEQCPKFPQTCPNNCDSELKVNREDMDAHKKECPLETVHCQYQCVGCDDMMVRQCQREHNKENMEKHLALAVSELVTLQQKMQHDVTSVKVEVIQRLTKTEHDLAITQQELTTTRLDSQQKTNDLKRRSTETERDLVTVKQQLASARLNAAKTEDELKQKLAKIEQDFIANKKELASVKAAKDQLTQKLTKTECSLAGTQQELKTISRDVQQKINDLKQKSADLKQEVASAKLNAVKTEGELNQRLTKAEQDLMSVRQTAAKTEDTINQRFTATKREFVSVKNAKDELAQKLTKTETEVEIVKKELATTKHNNSVAHAGFLVTEIKYKLPSINEEVTKMFTSLQGNINSVNQICRDVENTKRKHEQEVEQIKRKQVQEVNVVNRYTGHDQFNKYSMQLQGGRDHYSGCAQAHRNIPEMHSTDHYTMGGQISGHLLLNTLQGPQQCNAGLADMSTYPKKQNTQGVFETIKQNIERDQEQLLQSITQAEEDMLQQHDNIELHTKSINELMLQLDTLMKELTIYHENDVVKKLNTAKADMLKSENEIKEKTQDVIDAKYKLEIAKAGIKRNTRDLLQQLAAIERYKEPYKQQAESFFSKKY